MPDAPRSAILTGLLIERTPYRLHLTLGGHVTFEVGDKVIYPNHGLGVVQGIDVVDHRAVHIIGAEFVDEHPHAKGIDKDIIGPLFIEHHSILHA